LAVRRRDDGAVTFDGAPYFFAAEAYKSISSGDPFDLVEDRHAIAFDLAIRRIHLGREEGPETSAGDVEDRPGRKRTAGVLLVAGSSQGTGRPHVRRLKARPMSWRALLPTERTTPACPV
jgi:hypothetical protein